MFLVPHPEVLADDWLAPVPLGREAEVHEVVRRLDPPRPTSPPPWIVAVAGAPGTGTSTVARRAARGVADRLREAGGPPARLLAVRVAPVRGPHGVATALLRRIDDGFDGRGFPTAEILAGVLRRLRRDGRPVVVVLDDISIGGPELVPVLRAFADPDRFLPEGEHGLPPIWVILAGTEAGLATVLAGGGPRLTARPFVLLGEYGAETLEGIVRDRATRALGRAPPEALVGSVVARAVAHGGGARTAFDLLRRDLLGGGLPVGAGRLPDAGILVEPHVLDAIGQASHGSVARLGEVRRWEAKFARKAGLAPLPTTTLWRRIVRLERAGYLRREIRTGGPGGTLSVLRVLTPLDEWVTVARPRTRPIDSLGGRPGPSSSWPAGAPPRPA